MERKFLFRLFLLILNEVQLFYECFCTVDLTFSRFCWEHAYWYDQSISIELVSKSHLIWGHRFIFYALTCNYSLHNHNHNPKHQFPCSGSCVVFTLFWFIFQCSNSCKDSFQSNGKKATGSIFSDEDKAAAEAAARRRQEQEQERQRETARKKEEEANAARLAAQQAQQAEQSRKAEEARKQQEEQKAALEAESQKKAFAEADANSWAPLVLLFLLMLIPEHLLSSCFSFIIYFVASTSFYCHASYSCCIVSCCIIPVSLSSYSFFLIFLLRKLCV